MIALLLVLSVGVSLLTACAGKEPGAETGAVADPAATAPTEFLELRRPQETQAPPCGGYRAGETAQRHDPGWGTAESGFAGNPDPGTAGGSAAHRNGGRGVCSRNSTVCSNRPKRKIPPSCAVHRGWDFSYCRKSPLGLIGRFFAVCCAQNMLAVGDHIPHLQPDMYFLSGTRPDRK